MKDISGEELLNREIRIEPNQEYVFQIKGKCATGKYLRATTAENFQVRGRFENTGVFVDLTTTGLALGAYNNIEKIFDIKIIADDGVNVLESTVFRISS